MRRALSRAVLAAGAAVCGADTGVPSAIFDGFSHVKCAANSAAPLATLAEHACARYGQVTDCAAAADAEARMTPAKCFAFCRTVGGALFFELVNSHCGCLSHWSEPRVTSLFFLQAASRSASNGGLCDIACPGDAREPCGGSAGQADLFAMHHCADIGSTLSQAQAMAAAADQRAAGLAAECAVFTAAAVDGEARLTRLTGASCARLAPDSLPCALASAARRARASLSAPCAAAMHQRGVLAAAGTGGAERAAAATAAESAGTLLDIDSSAQAERQTAAIRRAAAVLEAKSSAVEDAFAAARGGAQQSLPAGVAAGGLFAPAAEIAGVAGEGFSALCDLRSGENEVFVQSSTGAAEEIAAGVHDDCRARCVRAGGDCAAFSVVVVSGSGLSVCGLHRDARSQLKKVAGRLARQIPVLEMSSDKLTAEGVAVATCFVAKSFIANNGGGATGVTVVATAAVK